MTSLPLVAPAGDTNFWMLAPGVGSKARLSTTAFDVEFRFSVPNMLPMIGVSGLYGYVTLTE